MKKSKPFGRRVGFLQQLEDRRMLFISAQNEGPYYPLNTAAYTVAAPGVLGGVNGSSPPFTASPVERGCARHGEPQRQRRLDLHGQRRLQRRRFFQL
ncbi:MAG TPA: hypothetical protein VG125_06935 [Pirellulales bacterium]|nr:hypothetical protein [Pirellulales bacterium]